MKPLPILLAACLAAGCATGPVVEVEDDPSIDFRRYHSFAWKQEPPIGNPMLRQRVVAAVDAELAAVGWRRVPEADADVVLVGNVSSREDTSLSYFYAEDDWNGWNWSGQGRRLNRVEQHTLQVGTLVLDMFDGHTRRAVWRGIAHGMVPESEARRTRDAMAAVRGMFSGFPPDPGARADAAEASR